MKIKRFFAKDMRAALADVKETLGADAVIMSNKKVTGGIEIVAAVDYQAKSSQEPAKSNRELKEDAVQLSGKPRPASGSSKSQSQAQRQANKINGRSGEELADSLASLLERQNKGTGTKPQRPTGKSRPVQASRRPPQTLQEQMGGAAATNQPGFAANRRSAPRTLQEQNEWQAQNRPKKAPVSNNEGRQMEAMREEMATLRKLLEHQVSGLMWQEMERKEPIRAMLIKWLGKAGFSDEIADQLAGYIPEECPPAEAKLYLTQLLEGQICVGDNEILSYGGAVALLGPTGVGKTTTIAKLAARFAMEHGADQVALVTTDTYRIGAHEQLATYGKILGCPVRVAKDADELSEALYQLRSKRLVLIDTAGMGQRDVRLSEQLATLMKNSRVKIRSYLVVPATSQRRVVQEAIEHFRKIPLSGCILTKLDESLSLGEILSVTIQHALPISYITDGQRVPEDIKVASAQYLAASALSLMERRIEQDDHQWYSEPNEYQEMENFN